MKSFSYKPFIFLLDLCWPSTSKGLFQISEICNFKKKKHPWNEFFQRFSFFPIGSVRGVIQIIASLRFIWCKNPFPGALNIDQDSRLGFQKLLLIFPSPLEDWSKIFFFNPQMNFHFDQSMILTKKFIIKKEFLTFHEIFQRNTLWVIFFPASW